MSRFRSSLIAACMLAAAALSVAVVSVDRGWHRVTRAFDAGLAWLVAKIPAASRSWMRRDLVVRVRLDGTIRVRALHERRPTVSPRWRLVPSI